MIAAIFITATLCLASGQPPDGYYPGTLTVTPEIEQCRIEDISGTTVCENHSGSTFFPNGIRSTIPDFDTLLTEFNDWERAPQLLGLSMECAEVLKLFTCFAYFPLCSQGGSATNPEILLYPCRDLCEKFTAECRNEFVDNNQTWPEWVDCSTIESLSRSNTCPKCVPLSDPECTSPTVPGTTDPEPTDSTPCNQSDDSNETEDNCDPETNPTIRPPVTIPPSSCIPLDNECCRNYFNYNSTFPSVYRSNDLTTSTEYNSEFNDFAAILEADTPCSDYIKTFLCFTYFPLCDDKQQIQPIYPCSEVCEYILQQNSSCREQITSALGHLPEWLESYDCDELNSNEDGGCAEGPDPPQSQCHATVAPTTSTTQPPTQPTRPPTQPTRPPTESPTEPPACCDIATCRRECKYRSSASSKTFKVNDFSFAARVVFVNLLSNTGCKAYNVTILRHYSDLTEVDTCNTIPELVMETHATIYTDIEATSETCKFDFEFGPEYLIAGYHYECDGGTHFKLNCDDALVTPWIRKFETRLEGWILSANGVRSNNC